MWRKYPLYVTKFNYSVNQRWVRKIQSPAEGYLKNPGSELLCYDTLGDVIAQTVDKYPDRVAVKSVHEDVTITYEQLLKQADSLGCALRSQGLEKGDRLGIWTHNSVSWIVAVIAAARAGLISVLINPVYEKNELGFCIKKTGMKSLLVGNPLPNRDYNKTLLQLLPNIQTSKPGSWTSKEFPNLTSIINTGKNDLKGTLSYNSLIAGGGSQISQYSSEVKSADGSIIHLTSGTTGDPKAALDSHLGAVNNTYLSGKRNGFHKEHHKICVQVPLFHALGSIVTVLAGFRHGSSIILPSPTYNLDANIKALFAEGCTSITGTPTMYVDMVSKVKTMGDIPSKLRMALAAGAPCSPQLIRDMQKYLKADVKALYGMTETTASSFQSLPDDSIDLVAETVGYIQDHTEAKVVDEDGEIVPFGSPGELMLRGYNNMIGYWDDPEKTKQTVSEDGWLKTGDLFAISKDGYGRVVGRLKDIIVRGGENIAPKEIEDILNTHPDIVESQVIGVADERLGEELCAVLRLKEGASISPDDIKQHCTGRIARFKIPRIVKITQEFPKTTSGKIQKHRVKKIVESGQLN
ncbi:unnamed protein product [Arctia plantaginis]|uniref:Medium-chain acyl-CoA ligase ACSF2, mitochondrial n=1 Tax=Arctia plantaginis TaxID=874455 RepID=A0A8S0YXN3_ARCPL|nr:unnamed protein product [Arctia plantaginis]CAB3247450.1 unnamed protein product [Arctia plantaginis]